MKYWIRFGVINSIMNVLLLKSYPFEFLSFDWFILITLAGLFTWAVIGLQGEKND